MDEDIKLMLDFKAGSRPAFDRLVDKYRKPIINFIYRFTGSRADAEDLAQDVFIKVFNAAANYAPSAGFKTWLYRIASNVSIDHIRKRKTSGNPASLDEHLETEDGKMQQQAADEKMKPADSVMEREETEKQVQAALQSLPENQRAAIILKIYEDRPYSEIAAVMGVSVASVESLLFRARQELRKKLGQKDKSR